MFFNGIEMVYTLIKSILAIYLVLAQPGELWAIAASAPLPVGGSAPITTFGQLQTMPMAQPMTGIPFASTQLGSMQASPTPFSNGQQTRRKSGMGTEMFDKGRT